MRGISVVLYERTRVGVDELNNAVWEETPVTVDNVLVGQPSTDEATNTLNLYCISSILWILFLEFCNLCRCEICNILCNPDCNFASS